MKNNNIINYHISYFKDVPNIKKIKREILQILFNIILL